MKKYIALLLALALCLGVFSACGSGSGTADPGFDTVVAAIEGVVSTDGMAQMDADYIKNMFNLTTEDYEPVSYTHLASLRNSALREMTAPMRAPQAEKRLETESMTMTFSEASGNSSILAICSPS